MIPLLHAGLTATIYIALREWFPMPWLWPLDDGLWLAGAIVILAAWSFAPRREIRLVHGTVIGLIVAGLAIVVLTASFPLIARPLLDRLQSPGPDSLRFAMTLTVWSVAAFLLAIAALAGGVIAGAVARWRRVAMPLTVAAMLVPLAATASHAVLGIGLFEVARCRERLLDRIDITLQPPRVLGSRADCFGDLAPDRDSN